MQEPDRATASETDPQGKGRQNRVLQISAKSEKSNLEMKTGRKKPPADTLSFTASEKIQPAYAVKSFTNADNSD